MSLICPDCRGELQMASARWAVCAQHGGRFEVLFDRGAGRLIESPLSGAAAAVVRAEDSVASPPVEASASAMCKAHPRQSAVAHCPSCGTALCALCSFDLNGKAYCADCAVVQAKVKPDQRLCPACGQAVPPSVRQCNCGHNLGMLNLSAPRRPEVASGMCADHPEMPAVCRCKICAKWICATCDFALPGGVHLCPSCIESQSTEEISPKRKRQTYIALALATWSTILVTLLFGGAFNSLFTPDAGGKAADLVITNLILWPLLIGTGLSIGALDKRLKSSGLMKGVAWWNGILAGLFLLLVIAANLGLIGK